METKQDYNSETNNNDHQIETPSKISSYEKTREERIKKNLEKMQKLGLLDLSLKLKSRHSPPHLHPPKRRHNLSSSNTKNLSSPFPPSGPLRRSSRLQNVTPVSYTDTPRTKKEELLADMVVELEVGSKPEIYTEEHEKLLGNTSRSWTLFVDGYGKDGKRIYDQVRGKTCHQCRQKTLGYRTHCLKCNIVQGQFCGDCLYMRYGEHVLEAIENPDWICPVCRGICNCSLCRQAKGWAPTGPLYRRISKLGYKSVAHYLIQTRHAQTSVEDLTAANQVSARRSLSLSLMNESPMGSDKEVELLEPEFEDKNKREAQLPNNEIKVTDVQTKRSLIFSSSEEPSRNINNIELNHQVFDEPGSSNPESEVAKGNLENKIKELRFTPIQQEVNSIPPEYCLNIVAAEVKLEVKLQVGLSKPEVESEERNLDKEKVKLHSTGKEQESKNNLPENCQNIDAEDSNCEIHDKLVLSKLEVEYKKNDLAEKTQDKDQDNNSTLKSSQKLKRKHALFTEQNPNSIGARVRQRQRNGKVDVKSFDISTNQVKEEN